MQKRALAVGAHPDDIEFTMAGTLFLLGEAGYELHYMTIANGSCGTVACDRETIIRIRGEEARRAADFIHAVYHAPLTDDLDIFYERRTLLKLSSIMRQVAPEIILTHSPYEYMEDHSNTCRLVLTAAFSRGMPNFNVDPPHPPIDQPVTVYHSVPLGGLDPLEKPVLPGLYIDISRVISWKREMLAKHRSQKEWLDFSQGMDSYLHIMEENSRKIGQLSGRFVYAEGWIKHLHQGYCDAQVNPLVAVLGEHAFIPG
jgi:LmbE family N-acetylglucosaminyl deacetylase